VILNRIMGIEVSETPDAWRLHVGAGENWHQLVQFTLQHAMPGLENLALIPGCAGSSPIQNIGAYGVELQRVCQYVDCIELETGVSSVFQRRNAVLAIVTVSLNMNIRIATPSSRLVYR
jgi:UDP-N-acetylmuramate dehydrogenase